MNVSSNGDNKGRKGTDKDEMAGVQRGSELPLVWQGSSKIFKLHRILLQARISNRMPIWGEKTTQVQWTAGLCHLGDMSM